MRLYHFLSAKDALSDLELSRLKISTFKDVNDPFDLSPFNTDDGNIRNEVRTTKNRLQLFGGMICLSRSWTSPVLWGNYADKHQGICLGFEIPRKLLNRVKYVVSRPDIRNYTDDKLLKALFITKGKSWSYEKEWRQIIRLDDCTKDGNYYFYPFNKALSLREVILGAKSKLCVEFISESIVEPTNEIIIRKACLSDSKFQIVESTQCIRFKAHGLSR